MNRTTRHRLRHLLTLVVVSALPATAADFDRERFTSLSDVMKHPKAWQGLVEQLSLGEMPPKEKPQPAPQQRERLLVWASAVLDEIALARAGDPGPVVLR